MKTIYDIKEYSTVYSGNKGAEELAVVAIIMTLLNNNKFDSIEDALKYSGNSLSSFLKNNNRDVVPLHYGNALKDSDFDSIIKNFNDMISRKMVIDEESLNKSKFDEKEYVEHNGTVFDNTLKDEEIEKELKDIQKENPEYQSEDAEKNTDALVDFVVNNKKEEVDFVDLESIDKDNLNAEEKLLYEAALEQKREQNIDNLKISFEKRLTKDDEDNLRQINIKEDKIEIVNNEQQVDVSYDNYLYLNEFDVSTLDSNEHQIYDAAVNYQLNLDEPIRLSMDSMTVINSSNEVYNIVEQDGVYVVNDERFMENSNEFGLEKEKEKVKVLKLEKHNNYLDNAA